MSPTPSKHPPITRRGFIQSAAAAGAAALATRGFAARTAQAPIQPSIAAAPSIPFRLATGASSLAARIDSTETTLLVATGSGRQVWQQAGGFDIEVGSEVMGVTAIAGTTSPQTFTVTRSGGLATSHPPGTSIQIVDTSNL